MSYSQDRFHRQGRYTDAFFEKIERGSSESARRIVPSVLSDFAPRSIVDVGCGTGAWAQVFWALGVEVLGVDGSYVSADRRQIREYVEWDLEKAFPDLGRFDMALSLEVAEHLPRKCADQFVLDLTNLSDRVLFSAAVPGQGGDGHVNEQPHQYWIDRFGALGLTADAAWRRQFLDDESVAPWYRQNMIVFEKAR